MNKVDIGHRHLHEYFCESSNHRAQYVRRHEISNSLHSGLPNAEGTLSDSTENIDRSATVFESEGYQNHTADTKGSAACSVTIIQQFKAEAQFRI